MSDNLYTLFNSEFWPGDSNVDIKQYLDGLSTSDLVSDIFDDLENIEPAVNNISTKKETDQFNSLPATVNLDTNLANTIEVLNFDGNNTEVKMNLGQVNTILQDLNEMDRTLMPPPPNPATEVTFEDKMKARRDRNQIAARRCRNKKVNKIEELKDQIAKVKAENSAIELEIAKLSEHLRNLRVTVINYRCQNGALKPEFSERF